jgi:4,5-DOPA dioxygenase extradiol
MKKKMPVIFIGHGSPENAIEKNVFTEGWKKFARTLPRPKAILCISAHWVTPSNQITSMEEPRTIHDFYGFEEELYKVGYQAPGSTRYAKLIQKTLKSFNAKLNEDWGFDHGTWSIMRNLFPKADIPVIQLSIDYNLSLEDCFKLGQKLKRLRTEGILIIGSGNIVHNLMRLNPDSEPYEWATDFDSYIKESLEKKDYDSLINYTKHRSAFLAQPSNEHFRPLLYIVGAAEGEKPKFFNEIIYAGSISMRCAIFGASR